MSTILFLTKTLGSIYFICWFLFSLAYWRDNFSSKTGVEVKFKDFITWYTITPEDYEELASISFFSDEKAFNGFMFKGISINLSYIDSLKFKHWRKQREKNKYKQIQLKKSDILLSSILDDIKKLQEQSEKEKTIGLKQTKQIIDNLTYSTNIF